MLGTQLVTGLFAAADTADQGVTGFCSKLLTEQLVAPAVAAAVAWPDPKGGRRPARKQEQPDEAGAVIKLHDAAWSGRYSGAGLESEEILELGVANADIP